MNGVECQNSNKNYYGASFESSIDVARVSKGSSAPSTSDNLDTLTFEGD